MQSKQTLDGPNSAAISAGLGRITIPIKPGEKAPFWAAWQKPETTYSNNGGLMPSSSVYDTMACGVGFRCGVDMGDGTCLLGIDVDATKGDTVQGIGTLLRERLGAARLPFYRVGKPPKRLYPVRVNIAELGEHGGKAFKPIAVGHLTGSPGDKIEMMYRGKQFVAWGMHPTGALYEWFGTITNEKQQMGTVFRALRKMPVTELKLLGDF